MGAPVKADCRHSRLGVPRGPSALVDEGRWLHHGGVDLSDIEAAPSSARTRGVEAGPARAVRHHKVRWTLLGVITVVIAFFLVSMILTFEGRARPVSVGDAVSHYHSGTSVDPGTRPVPGVYTYKGNGTDSLSLPPLSQAEGPTLPGTVELRAKGCWNFRIDYSTNHWQSWTYCPGPAGLQEAGGQVWQRWIVGPLTETNLSSLHCDPGALALPEVRSVGKSSSARCTGRSTQITGEVVSADTSRFIGESTIVIGGHSVPAVHFLQHQTLSGAQVGIESDDLWFDATTGLPLENRRSIRVRTDTPFGSSTYTETGEFELRSLTPVT